MQGKGSKNYELRHLIKIKKLDLKQLLKQIEVDDKYQKQLERVAELKKADISIDEYVMKSTFKQRLWDQVQANHAQTDEEKQKVFRDLFGKKITSQHSPVKQMIDGNNPKLLYAQFEKNFGTPYQKERKTIPTQRAVEHKKIKYRQNKGDQIKTLRIAHKNMPTVSRQYSCRVVPSPLRMKSPIEEGTLDLVGQDTTLNTQKLILPDQDTLLNTPNSFRNMYMQTQSPPLKYQIVKL